MAPQSHSSKVAACLVRVCVGTTKKERAKRRRLRSTEKIWSQKKARAKQRNGLSDRRAKQAPTVLQCWQVGPI